MCVKSTAKHWTWGRVFETIFLRPGTRSGCLFSPLLFNTVFQAPRWHLWIKKAEHQRINAFELWCWRRSWESLGQKEIKPVNPKGDQLWTHWKDWWWSWSSNTLANWCKELTHGKDPNGWKDWRQKEKRVMEDRMVGRHHRFSGQELGKMPGDGEGC